MERQVTVFVTKIIIKSLIVIIVIMVIMVIIIITGIIIIIITRQESEQGSLGERTLPLTQGLGESIITSINGIDDIIILLEYS